MSKSVALCILICLAAALATVSLCRPHYLDDTNAFLKSFVSGELLALLGIVLPITLSSASQLHISFNQLEEHYKNIGGLKSARDGVKQAVAALIALFCFAIAVVLAKSFAAGHTTWQALLNSTALWIVAFYVLLLISMTSTVFSIPPRPQA